MNANTIAARAQPGNWVAGLLHFVRRPALTETEHCELCAAPLAVKHAHLVEPDKHRLLCVCRECAILLGNSEDSRYRRVPERTQPLTDMKMSDAEWDAFGIPIGLAFFFQSTREGRVLAFYPGPAGPTQSLLDLGAWSQLVANNPVLAEMQPDVEALLVNRVNGAREYYRTPIDRCYALVGLIRASWRGMSGGDDAWKAIDSFFAQLCERHSESGACRHG